MDIKNYIGLPYETHGRDEKGVDCWGLVRLIYKNELGIELPSFVECYKTVYDKSLKGLVEDQQKNWKRTDEVKKFNVVLFRSKPYHVGILINEKGDMIHNTFGKDTCIENIYGKLWRNKIEGIFEYA